MRNAGLRVGGSRALLLGLLLVPACGGHGLSSSKDATPGSQTPVLTSPRTSRLPTKPRRRPKTWPRPRPISRGGRT